MSAPMPARRGAAAPPPPGSGTGGGVEGRAVSDTGDLARITRSRGVGDLVDITVRRDGKLLDLTIPLVKAEG